MPPKVPYGQLHAGQVRGSKMLEILPQFDAANAIRTIVLTDPKARITQGIPDAPSAKSAKREITSASLINEDPLEQRTTPPEG